MKKRISLILSGLVVFSFTSVFNITEYGQSSYASEITPDETMQVEEVICSPEENTGISEQLSFDVPENNLEVYDINSSTEKLSPEVALLASNLPSFNTDSFFVVVGTYGGNSTQLRYFHSTGNGTYDAEKVVLENSKDKYFYGDILISEDEISLKRVQSAPNDPVYAMAYYYVPNDSMTLNYAGNVLNLLDKKELTVTNLTYDGSAHWSIDLEDSVGEKYYYGLNTFGSSLTISIIDSQVGDKHTFAMFNNAPVIPIDTSVSSMIELSDFITETAGDHILLTKTSDYLYPDGYSTYLIALDSYGKYHLYSTTLTDAFFTTDDNFDLNTISSEIKSKGIKAEITADGKNKYSIKNVSTPDFTTENYLRLIAYLKGLDEVTHIEHNYSIAEDTQNRCDDPIFMFNENITTDYLNKNYNLNMNQIDIPYYQREGKPICMNLITNDLAVDFPELKRLTENEDYFFICSVTSLAVLFQTKYKCREVLYDKSTDINKSLNGDANMDGKTTIADAVAILQHLANHDKYALKPQGLANADVDGVSGVTANDARVLQQWDSDIYKFKS